MNVKTITLDGAKYSLDTTRAVALGVLTKILVARPIKFEDLKNGQLHQYKSWDGWTGLYLMENKDLNEAGQTRNLHISPTARGHWGGGPSEFRVLQADGSWKETITD